MSENKVEGFDLVVHHKDPKTGQILKRNPYRRHCNGSLVLYERDNKFYAENGEQVRSDGVKIEQKKG